jgi:AbrB family looped-hinge helix DNA binding protein
MAMTGMVVRPAGGFGAISAWGGLGEDKKWRGNTPLLQHLARTSAHHPSLHEFIDGLKSLLGNTLERTMQTTTMTSKGQVTIPKEVRLKLGLRQGTQIAFVVEGDHAVLRPALPQRADPASGFGMVRVTGPDLPPDFDVASILRPKKAPAARPASRGSRR